MKLVFLLLSLFSSCVSFSQENPNDFDSLFNLGIKLYRQNKDYKNAAFTFSAAFHLNNAHPSIDQRYTSAFVWNVAKFPDSAFSQLAIIAESKDLTFEDVSNILNDPDFESIYIDPRWKLYTNRMFATLRKKYIPPEAFRKIRKDKSKIQVDEGHYNGHKIAQHTYSALAGLLEYCGFKVSPITEKFSATSLANTNLLIISNPYPNSLDSLTRWARANNVMQEFRWHPNIARPAYTDDEAEAIKAWVEKGGSLLLILDHAPNPKSGSPISNAFGIDWPNVSTYDTLSWDPKVDTARGARTILFTRSKGSFGKHPILKGVDSVTTYTGSSLVCPKAMPLLYLSPTAYDQDWDPAAKKLRWKSAAGRTQALAMEVGRGRVVMLGEANMISFEPTSRSNRGNWQMTLNILRWLTGDIK